MSYIIYYIYKIYIFTISKNIIVWNYFTHKKYISNNQMTNYLKKFKFIFLVEPWTILNWAK